jgi:mRNA interferase RelE/StbE
LPKVVWGKDALDDLNKIDKPVIKRILNKITWFSQHFNNITPESLSGDMTGLFKLRVGDWGLYIQSRKMKLSLKQ